MNIFGVLFEQFIASFYNIDNSIEKPSANTITIEIRIMRDDNNCFIIL